MDSSSSVTNDIESLPYVTSRKMSLDPSLPLLIADSLGLLLSPALVRREALSTLRQHQESDAQSIPKKHPQPVKNSLQPQLSLGSKLYLFPSKVCNCSSVT